MDIEVFADVWCPFTHVGLRLVAEERSRRRRDDVRLFVRAWPLELVNGRPMDPDLARRHVEELRAEVSPEAFAGLDVTRFPMTTLPALALVARAYRHGHELGERASFAVRDALFERGEDIGDTAVVRRLADDLGIGVPDDQDHAAVLVDWEEGRRRGVIGSPHFFCGATDVFCPSLEITRPVKGAPLVIHRDAARLRAFLDAVLQA